MTRSGSPAAPVLAGRRRTLQLPLRGLLAALLAAAPQWARALLPDWQRRWNEAAFAARGEAAALAALGWQAPVQESTEVLLDAPEIAESGAVVPVAVASQLPGTRRIVLLALDNPNTLTADFTLHAGMAPRIATRIKLGGTTTVVALVESERGLACARRLVKVTQGGCGG